MKKVVVLMMLLAGATAMAQEGERHHRGGMQDMTPEQVAALQTKKMTLALDLSEEQQQQIQALNLENAKLRKTKMEERKAQKESGETKKPTSEERFALQNARLDHQIAQKTEMKKILSQEQYEKWGEMHHGKRKYHRSKGEKRTGKK